LHYLGWSCLPTRFPFVEAKEKLRRRRAHVFSICAKAATIENLESHRKCRTATCEEKLHGQRNGWHRS